MSGTIEVLVGTVGRAHGLRGEVSVRVRTDEPERRFAVGADLSTPQRRLRVAATRAHARALLVTFAGISDRSSAEELRGADLWARVPAGEVPASADEYYDRQLVGLAVQNRAGETVGQVSEVVHLPAHDSLVVQTHHGFYQVPFVAELVPVVDVDAGYVGIAEVGGLLGDPDTEDA